MSKSIILFCFIIFEFSNNVYAQYGFSQEIGVLAGPVAFQSDYGERLNLSTNAGNTGYGIGLIHYFNFSYDAVCNCFTLKNYFNDHFKLRSELSYNKTDLQHFGNLVTSQPSASINELKAMRGSTAVTNIGMQLEFFPFSIHNFSETIGSWVPFISLGAQFCFYNAKASSTMGPLESNLTEWPKYLNPSAGRPHGFSSEEKSVWSAVSSVGTRYKLAPLSDLMIDLRIQYYYSNWVDGLNPDPTIYKENKSNDWLVWFNVGYIYYLQ